jgi:uncharacterized membrane protein
MNPQLNQQCVVAVFDSLEAAKEALAELETAKIPADCVSLVTNSVERQTPQTETMQYGDDTASDAAKGAGAGGLLGLLLGAPLLAIPGVGLMLVAGPLAMGITGAIVGGFLGSMAGWGVGEDHVAAYEQQVREGAVLIVINGDPQEVAESQGILQESRAQSVDLHAKTSADDVDP